MRTNIALKSAAENAAISTTKISKLDAHSFSPTIVVEFMLSDLVREAKSEKWWACLFYHPTQAEDILN